MAENQHPAPGQDGALLLFLLALGALLTPMLLLWTAPGRPWWLIFLVWGALIAVTACVNRRRDPR